MLKLLRALSPGPPPKVRSSPFDSVRMCIYLFIYLLYFYIFYVLYFLYFILSYLVLSPIVADENGYQPQVSRVINRKFELIMQEMFILYFLRRVTICPSKNFFPKREKKLSGIKRILKFIYLKRDQI